MAAPTYTWNTITTGQTDGDSPLDQTLMDGIRENLIHLEEWLGDGYTAAKDHDHDGTNSALVTAIGTGAVDQDAIANDAVGQGELKTTLSSVSASNATVLIALPGGTYGFYPQTKWTSTSGGGTFDVQIAYGLDSTKSSYATYIYFNERVNGDSADAQQRYITASPPYNLGNGDIPIFIFAMVNNSTGEINSTYIAEDPPWAYNGPKRINPKKVITRAGKKYIQQIKRPWSHNEAKKSKSKFVENMAAVRNPVIEEIEMTHAIKNAGMPDIPHPFANFDSATHTIVLLDPCSSLCLNLYELTNDSEEGTTEISEILYEGRIKFGNTPINGLITPPGVIGVKMRLG